MSLLIIGFIFLIFAAPLTAQEITINVEDTDESAKEAFELSQRWSIDEADEIIYALQNKLPMPNFVDTESWDTSVKRYDLRGIDFSNADLNNIDLSHANLMGVNFDRSDLEESNLTDTNLENAVLSLTNLWKADISDSILKNALLTDAILDEADLRSSDLQGAVFTGASLNRTDLSHTDMKGALLTGGDFSNADLSYADLTGASMFGADLGGVNIIGANLSGAVLEPEQIWEIDFKGARNMAEIVWGNELAPGTYMVNDEINGNLSGALIKYRDLKNLYKLHFQNEAAGEFHYRENVVKTKLSPEPLRTLRLVFLDWTYGYGSKPLRLIPFCVGVILVFGFIYTIQTVLPGRSGIYLINKGEDLGKTFYVRETGDTDHESKSYVMEEIVSQDSKPSLLKFEKGAVIVNCIYFSLLSFATFGYGAIKPRQWLEFFRLTPVQYRPAGWSRIFVGFEAACGIYLLALTAIILFG